MVKVLLMQIYITFHEPGVQLFLGGQSIQCSMKNGKIGYNQFLPLNGIAPGLICIYDETVGAKARKYIPAWARS